MKSVLITGANKGIGFETARHLLQNDYFVYLGTRDLQKGEQAVATLKSEGLTNVEAIQIDVTNEDAVKNARVALGNKIENLDVLINNAGIAGSLPQSASELTIEQFKEVFNTNLYGVVRVINAFRDLLQKSAMSKIINISSSIGSLTLHTNPEWQYYDNANLFGVYSTSKAALNMYSIALAFDLRNTTTKLYMVDPGYIKTDFNYNNGTGTVEEAATRVMNVLKNDNLPSGSFVSEETDPVGSVCPW